MDTVEILEADVNSFQCPSMDIYQDAVAVYVSGFIEWYHVENVKLVKKGSISAPRKPQNILIRKDILGTVLNQVLYLHLVM